MSDPLNQYQVDVLQVAERMLASGEGLASLTRLEAIALAGFVIQQNDGKTPALRLPTDPLDPALPASLAAAVAAAVRAFDQYQATPAGAERMVALVSLETAFNNLKTRFEKEFPHV